MTRQLVIRGRGQPLRPVLSLSNLSWHHTRVIFFVKHANLQDFAVLRFANSMQIQQNHFHQKPMAVMHQSFVTSWPCFHVYIQAAQHLWSMHVALADRNISKRLLKAASWRAARKWREVKWKWSFEKYFCTAKLKTRIAGMPTGRQTKRLTMTQAVASSAITEKSWKVLLILCHLVKKTVMEF